MGVEAAPVGGGGGHFNISLDQDTTGRCLSPTIPPPPYELPPYADKPPAYSTLARHGGRKYGVKINSCFFIAKKET